MGRILSVYVENEGMRVCELSKSGSTVTVKNAFEIPLRSGAVEDGIIQDVEEVAGALGAALKNNNIKTAAQSGKKEEYHEKNCNR